MSNPTPAPTGQPSPLEMRLVTYLLRSKRIMDQTRYDVVISREEVRRIFDLTRDAANELARLRSEVEQMRRERDEAREALEGFLALEAMDPDDRSDYDIDSTFEAARRALTPGPPARP